MTLLLKCLSTLIFMLNDRKFSKATKIQYTNDHVFLHLHIIYLVYQITMQMIQVGEHVLNVGNSCRIFYKQVKQHFIYSNSNISIVYECLQSNSSMHSLESVLIVKPTLKTCKGLAKNNGTNWLLKPKICEMYEISICLKKDVV